MMFRAVELGHGSLAVVAFAFRVRVTCSRSRSRFTFAIRDTIGRGMTWGDVMMNSFAFLRESRWHVTKSVAFLSRFKFT